MAASICVTPCSTRLFTKLSPSSSSPWQLQLQSQSQTFQLRKTLTIKALATSIDYSKVSVVDKSLSPSNCECAYIISVTVHGKFTNGNGQEAYCTVQSDQGLAVKEFKSGTWQWKFQDKSVNIYYEEHKGDSSEPCKDILMIPTISDVSTVEEWRSVAKDIVQQNGKVNWRATILDWPGLGYSDRPKIDYNADIMEAFLVEFINAPDRPLQHKDGDLVVCGGGHAATIALRAAQKGLVKTSAIAAVAPTWGGPLPIVFGRDSNMESRYGLLRGTLRAPAVGWMMYNVLVSNEKAIQSQYTSHVYADPKNVTPAIIESRYNLTKQKGARYVPAAFLTGLLDPVQSREEFLKLFAGLDGKMPVLVVSTKGSPKRSKAEMNVLKGARGVSKFVEVPGALLPQEEYPATVAEELYKFLQETFELDC